MKFEIRTPSLKNASVIITLIVAIITTFLISYLKAKGDAGKFAEIKIV